jgi:hypothetical protein
MIRLSVLALDGFVNFLAMNWDIVGGLDPKSNLVTAYIHDRYDNVVTDHDAFVSMSRQHQHERLLYFTWGYIQCSLWVVRDV